VHAEKPDMVMLLNMSQNGTHIDCQKSKSPISKDWIGPVLGWSKWKMVEILIGPGSE
jgi:hypothetical protein